MNRFLVSLRWETLIQWRQGIYYAAGFITIMWIALLFQIPEAGIQPVLISVLFLDLAIFGYFFMAALYYLEKGDRVIEGLVVTPLKVGEYLAIKVTILTLISVVVGALVTLVVYGTAINWFWYVVAVVVMSAPISLTGFVIAARYTGINEFLVPSIFLLGVLQIPLLGYFGIWNSWLLYIIPSMPGLLLLQAAFAQISTGELAYALIYSLLFTVGSYWWAQRMFENAIARKVGG
jgi:fluoroquinolone transport system permease protein